MINNKGDIFAFLFIFSCVLRHFLSAEPLLIQATPHIEKAFLQEIQAVRYHTEKVCNLSEEVKVRICNYAIRNAFPKYGSPIYLGKIATSLLHFRCEKKPVTFLHGKVDGYQHNMVQCYGRHNPIRTSWKWDDAFNMFYISGAPHENMISVFVREKHATHDKYVLYYVIEHLDVETLPFVSTDREDIDLEKTLTQNISVSSSSALNEINYIRERDPTKFEPVCNLQLRRKIQLCEKLITIGNYDISQLKLNTSKDVFNKSSTKCTENNLYLMYVPEVMKRKKEKQSKLLTIKAAEKEKKDDDMKDKQEKDELEKDDGKKDKQEKDDDKKDKQEKDELEKDGDKKDELEKDDDKKDKQEKDELEKDGDKKNELEKDDDKKDKQEKDEDNEEEEEETEEEAEEEEEEEEEEDYDDDDNNDEDDDNKNDRMEEDSEEDDEKTEDSEDEEEEVLIKQPMFQCHGEDKSGNDKSWYVSAGFRANSLLMYVPYKPKPGYYHIVRFYENFKLEDLIQEEVIILDDESEPIEIEGLIAGGQSAADAGPSHGPGTSTSAEMMDISKTEIPKSEGPSQVQEVETLKDEKLSFVEGTTEIKEGSTSAVLPSEIRHQRHMSTESDKLEHMSED